MIDFSMMALMAAFSLIVTVFLAPEFVLRLLVVVYPRRAERRRELLGELCAMRRLERPLWVAEQIETALVDGLRERVRLVRTADVPNDAALIQAVRSGDIAAYGKLYENHRVAARQVAAAIGADETEEDDLIAEGFARVLRSLRSGEGQDDDFRPYLLTTIRNTMISWRRPDLTVPLSAEVPDAPPGATSDEPVGSPSLTKAAADAFASLPKRWQTVLWRTEIDGESPARIAQDLGLTPNGVAALAYRAREGLRQAYLAQRVPSPGGVPRDEDAISEIMEAIRRDIECARPGRNLIRRTRRPGFGHRGRRRNRPG